MNSDRFLRRKWTLRAHGQQMVFVKGHGERPEHVLMKALIWALYLPDYGELQVERRIGDRYKPDVIKLDETGSPIFWGEAGKVSTKKIESLTRRFPDTHFAMSKWERRLQAYEDIVQSAVTARSRTAPFDLIRFQTRHVEQHIADNGEITISFDDIEWRRICPS